MRRARRRRTPMPSDQELGRAARLLIALGFAVGGARAVLVQSESPPRGFNTFDGFGKGSYTEADVLNISAHLQRDLRTRGLTFAQKAMMGSDMYKCNIT